MYMTVLTLDITWCQNIETNEHGDPEYEITVWEETLIQQEI